LVPVQLELTILGARDSNVGSIMCSYNSVNGTPACANEYLMQTVLRDHWNWTKDNNYIVSDCNAVHNIYADHKWLKTAAQAAGAAYTAGVDNVCEAGGWLTDVIGAYNQSLLSEKVIDRALKRQYEGLVRTDYFATSQVDAAGFRAYGWDKVNTKPTQDMARSSASDGMVLLKNDGTLPMNISKNTTVAVIGLWGNDTRSRMLGNYFGKPPYYHTPLYAVQQLGANAIYVNGPVAERNYSSTLAVNAAKAADVVLYFGGIDTSIESEDLDRNTTIWPSPQLNLLSELSALNKPIIVVQLGTMVSNTPLLMDKNIRSILWAGYPGMSGGTAALDIITGLKAPAGRLPITQYPAEYTQQVPMTDMSLRPSASNPGRTYKWYDNAVQEFGFGLHYTEFTIKFGAPYTNQTTKLGLPVFNSSSMLQNCTASHKDLCAFPTVPIIVTNTGTRTSDFVALAFITTAQGPAPQPIKELGSYKRVRDVRPGEERQVELEFSLDSFARVDESGNTVLYAGTYCLLLDVPEQARTCFEISGGDQVLDAWPQPKTVKTTGTVRKRPARRNFQ
jgi:beta-D-xylosidase 4